MRAMTLEAFGKPLVARTRNIAGPGADEVLIEIACCGVCRTDLHVVDGDLPATRLPVVPGHEIVGRIVEVGTHVGRAALGTRVGVSWLGGTCGACGFCREDRENLCDGAEFTGWTRDGGFATHVVARADYCVDLPDGYDDAHAAPLLCAGPIGYRALAAAGPAARLGIYGFGAAAHIVAQIAAAQGVRVFAFVRPGDTQARRFAEARGCDWAGPSDGPSPEPLDAAIVFAPVGALVPAALSAVAKGGTVVLGGIHMTDIPAMPYARLWGERVLRSVANLTRDDLRAFMKLAARHRPRTQIERYALDDAGTALDRLRAGRVSGAAVLVP